MIYSFPREIIKWIQSLDLSVQFRNTRRDLANGFLIAEIISRYRPGVLSLHSFENSHKTFFREDNWKQLAFVFSKLKMDFKEEEYDDIKDYNVDKTICFIVKLYQKLTHRKVELTKKILADGKNPKKTKTFLLTETGLGNINLKQRQEDLLDDIEGTNEIEPENFSTDLGQNKNLMLTKENSAILSKSEIRNLIENPSTTSKDKKHSIISSRANVSKKGSVFILKTKQKIGNDQSLNPRSGKTRFEETFNTAHKLGYKPIGERLNEILCSLNNEYNGECFAVINNDGLSYYNFSNLVNSFSEEFLQSFFAELSTRVS